MVQALVISIYSVLSPVALLVEIASLDSTKYSNAVVDWNGDLVVLETDAAGTIKKWDNTPVDSSNISIITKALDFDSPGISKYVYSVLVELKTAANENVVLDYYADDAAASTFQSIEVIASSNWSRERFEIADVTDSECENIRFGLITVTTAQLTVGKMIVEFRPLRAKRR